MLLVMIATNACRRLRARGPRASLDGLLEECSNRTTGQLEVSLGRITEIGLEIKEAESEVEAWQHEISADQFEADRIMERIRERQELVKARQQRIKELTAESVRLEQLAAELTGAQVGRLPLPPPVNYRQGSGSGVGTGAEGVNGSPLAHS